MAARKSTASASSRQSTTKPVPRQMTAKGSESTPAATSTSQPVQRITSAEPFGILRGDRIVATAADIDEAFNLAKASDNTYLVRLQLNDQKTLEAERATKPAPVPPPNPLGRELATQHSRTLDRLRFILGTTFDVYEPEGYASIEAQQLGCRTATDDEAAQCEIEFHGRTFHVDARSDIGPQTLAHLRSLIHELQSTANRLETDLQRGKIPGLAGKAVK